MTTNPDHIVTLAWIIRKVHGTRWMEAAALAEAILSHPASQWQQHPLTALPTLPANYIDREHQGEDLELLQTFYQACSAEGGTADEIHLRGLRAVLAAPPTALPAPEVGEVGEDHWYPSFADWLEREMPEGTVIGDPLWWASKIAHRIIRFPALVQQFHAPAPAAPEPEEGRWSEGVCGDGAAILFDGVMIPIEEVVQALNRAPAAPPAPPRPAHQTSSSGKRVRPTLRPGSSLPRNAVNQLQSRRGPP